MNRWWTGRLWHIDTFSFGIMLEELFSTQRIQVILVKRRWTSSHFYITPINVVSNITALMMNCTFDENIEHELPSTSFAEGIGSKKKASPWAASNTIRYAEDEDKHHHPCVRGTIAELLRLAIKKRNEHLIAGIPEEATTATTNRFGELMNWWADETTATLS